MQFDQRNTLGFHAAQLSRLIANRMRNQLAPLGLQPAQVAALIEISADEGLTQKQLVERLEVEQPGVARTLNGLEAGGWIERKSKGGGRAQGLYLTDKSRPIIPEALRISSLVNRQALASLSRTEQAHLLDQVAEIAASLRAG